MVGRMVHTFPTHSETPSVSSSNLSVARIVYSKAELCEVLQISPVSAWRLEKRGLLMPVPGLRHKIYARAAVDRFLAGKGIN